MIDSISEFSFYVNKHGNVVYLNKNLEQHPFLGTQHEFNESLAKKLKQVYSAFNASINESNLIEKSNKVFVYPLMQINDSDIKNDEIVTKRLFDSASETSSVILAAGYFNLTKDYITSIIEKSKANYKIIFSSPKANGFFESKGFSKNIPIIYSNIEEEFFRKIQKCKQEKRISLHEYNREKWSKHTFKFEFKDSSKVLFVLICKLITPKVFGIIQSPRQCLT